MPEFDLILRGGTVVTGGGCQVADVGVADGRIAAIAPELSGAADDVIESSGYQLLPGAIDPHVHFNEPGREAWEGWATGTRAAAAGGTTSVFDMPLNSTPPLISVAEFEAKRKAADGQALVDFGLWAGLVPDNLNRLEDLHRSGVVGFKAFMCFSGIDEFPYCDDLMLYEGMKVVASLGSVVAVHAENHAIVSGLAARARASGAREARDYLESRPVIAELEAISRAILLAEETGCSLHVVHVSTGRGALLVEEARRRGVDVTCETCPHYLVLTEEDVERLGVVAKCAPPIRSADEREALWSALDDGRVDFVASDHSPADPTVRKGMDFVDAWGGISGCQTRLELMLTDGHQARGFELAEIARWLSEAAARRFRLGLKGSLAVGCDADLVLIEPDGDHVLSKRGLFDRWRDSPYLGKRLRARVVRTIVRGRTVYANGQVLLPPVGRLLTPADVASRPATVGHSPTPGRRFESTTPESVG